MSELSKLTNIGKTLEKKLNDVDILAKDELFTLGSKEAFMMIRNLDSEVCLNTLYALEGAVQGIRWHYLPDEVKDNLKQFYKSI